MKRLFFLAVVAATVSLGVVAAAPAGVGMADEPCPTAAGENTNTCPAGTVGVPYAIQFREAEGSGCGPGLQTFNIDSGAFPPGLSLATSGQVSGTPTQAGNFTFYVRINEPTDRPPEEGCQGSQGEKQFTIPINPGVPKLTIGPESTTPGTVGAAYTLQMTATVADPKAWSIVEGSLPPGLTINASTGVISGTPTTAGSYPFTVYAAINAQRTDTKVLTIVVRAQLSIVAADPFSTVRLARTEVGAPFEANLAATGGDGTYTWSLTGNLPPGLTMSSGAIVGMPTAPGVYRFSAGVADAEGRKASYAGAISVAERLAVSTILLRPAKVGKLYGAKLAATGGIAPRTWKIKKGLLPLGLRLDRNLGVLFGTPRTPGRYRVTFQATDALKVTAVKTLVVNVLP